MLKTNTKKKICIILIVSMLFSLMPISAFAEENSTVTSGSCVKIRHGNLIVRQELLQLPETVTWMITC
jgi:hypothetical protein